ncbi:hypothetical protein EW026_g6014 [Hermanssonia centrifuga]|uniref:ABM domain-containing protein n=1 Tax=Hermanssonia centrifuga TaxID=98765 RepID=A0A4S4KCD6_9APHY|nr:hypothetical protein EW026_g6014 [Hermanssonia centrifuga]
MHSIYYGLQTEDNVTLHIEVAWKTIEDHQKLIDNPELYKKLGEALLPCMAGTPDMVHVYFNPSIAPVLNASVTSFCQIALQPGASEEEIKAEREKLVGSPSVHPVSASWGRAVERAEYILAEGWEESLQGATDSEHAQVRDQSSAKEINVAKKAFRVALATYKHYEQEEM